jgi:outer membrane protein assembly factor BamB/HEAT repeat protein
MMRPRLGLLLLLIMPGLAALAEDGEPDRIESRLRLEVDPHGLAHDLARVDSFTAVGQFEDALALLEKLARDPRAKDGFHEAKPGHWYERILTSFDGLVRRRLLAFPEAGFKAYDLRYDDEARRLEEQGRTDPAALAQLVARYPLSAQAPGAALDLADRSVEAGRVDAACTWLQLLLDDLARRATPDQMARARLELPVALAFLGRDGETDRALDKLAGEALARAREGVAFARKERWVETPPAAGSARAVGWAHDIEDYYDPGHGTPPPFSAPAISSGTVYVQNGAHLFALALGTGKERWRASLRPRDEGYRPADRPCSVALGETVVACPLSMAIVSVDRETGQVLFRLTLDDLRKLARIEDECALVPSVVVVHDVIVLPLEARHSEDELSLVGIDARTGALVWRTFVVAESADPKAADPVLAESGDRVFCLSNRGVVAALDPRSGSMLWLKRYGSLRDDTSGGPVRGRTDETPHELRSGFLGQVQGRLLAAPADAPRMLALDPRSGEVLYDTMDQGATVLGPWRTGLLELKKDGTVVAVGRNIETKLSNDGAELVAQPAIVGDVLILPLKLAVIRVDLLAKSSEALTDWTPFGGHYANLAAAQGMLLAVGAARTVAFAPSAPAAAIPPEDARAACRALGDPSFAVRQAAEAKLLDLGESARGELEGAQRSLDPEVRRRASFVLDDIARKERLAAWRPRLKEEWIHDQPRLLDKLTHRNAEVRLEGVRDLGLIGTSVGAVDTSVNPLLLELLKDADERVQGSAAIALLSRGDRTGVDQIGKLLDSAEKADRMAAIEAFKNDKREDDLRYLAKAAADEDPEVRGNALAAALMCNPEGAVPLVAKALDDKDDKVRENLMEALIVARLTAESVAPLYAKLSHDSLRAVREKALEQLGDKRLRHRREAISAFADGMFDSDPGVKKEAMQQLVDPDMTADDWKLFPVDRAEKAFDQPQIGENERFHLVQVAETCVEGHNRFAAAPLARTALEAEHVDLRQRALDVAFARAQLEDPFTALDVMAVASLTLVTETPGKEKNPDVRQREAVGLRYAAYQILAQAKGPGTKVALLRGLQDSDGEIQKFVKTALPLITDPDALRELLHREARPPRPEDSTVAAEALETRADDKKLALAPVLVEALADPDALVRAVAWKRVRNLAREDEDLGLFDPGATGEEHARPVRRAALWWWRQTHPKEGKDPVGAALAQLSAQAPAERWRAAKKLAELAVPCFRSLVTDPFLAAFAKLLSAEKEEYVLRQELATFAALTGKACTLREGASAEEREAAIRIALEGRH